MIVRIEDISSACAKILPAVDVSSYSITSETVQLSASSEILTLSVTNKEYFVAVKIPAPKEESFFATVNAELFLKLISSITTETVELSVTDKYLKVRGNGNYKLPLIFDEGEILEQPKITIDNEVQHAVMDGKILNDINLYNSKELLKGGGAMFPIQNYFYLDSHGCITFTSGACVTQFELPSDIRVLLTSKVVKLFKLFNNSDTVNVVVGEDAITDNIVQTKVRFYTNTVDITAIIPSAQEDIEKFPSTAVRNRANDDYDYSVVFNKSYLMQAVNRMLLFDGGEKLNRYLNITFNEYHAILCSYDNSNEEEVIYENEIEMGGEEYHMSIDANDLKLTLASCNDNYVNLSFGNHQAVTISCHNIINILSELG